MINLSLNQILRLWSDLEAAYYGKSFFAGDTIEIYMFRLMSSSPTVDLAQVRGAIGPTHQKLITEVYQQACCSLYSILNRFAEQKNARVWVNDRLLGPWLKKCVFDHRVQIRVKNREKTS